MIGTREIIIRVTDWARPILRRLGRQLACKRCKGSGRIRRTGYSVSGRPLSRKCPRCQGAGG